MPFPIVLFYGPMMAALGAEWTERYEAVFANGPSMVPPEKAASIEVVASGDTLPNSVVDALPNLKLVACFSTGYTGIDLAYLRERGISLTTGGGVNAHDVADHALALLLALWHKIPAADQSLRKGGWQAGIEPRASLRNRRAGVVGLGRIGGEIATRLAAVGLKVRWWGPHAKPDAGLPRAESLLALAQWADILIVASRADPGNRHQIDAKVLRALGPGGVIVNVSRGFLIDESAMIDALEVGELGGAALDVFEEEPTTPALWYGVPNLVLTPHLAGFTKEAGKDLRYQQRENVRRYFAGEPLLTAVGVEAA